VFPIAALPNTTFAFAWLVDSFLNKGGLASKS
jgi:hypothetical protein